MCPVCEVLNDQGALVVLLVFLSHFFNFHPAYWYFHSTCWLVLIDWLIDWWVLFLIQLVNISTYFNKPENQNVGKAWTSVLYIRHQVRSDHDIGKKVTSVTFVCYVYMWHGFCIFVRKFQHEIPVTCVTCMTCVDIAQGTWQVCDIDYQKKIQKLCVTHVTWHT